MKAPYKIMRPQLSLEWEMHPVRIFRLQYSLMLSYIPYNNKVVKNLLRYEKYFNVKYMYYKNFTGSTIVSFGGLL